MEQNILNKVSKTLNTYNYFTRKNNVITHTNILLVTKYIDTEHLDFCSKASASAVTEILVDVGYNIWHTAQYDSSLPSITIEQHCDNMVFIY
jgi:hypothetical protein